MRQASGRCIAKILQEVSSACSTSGRHGADYAPSYSRLFASGSGAKTRFDWFDPKRDVYNEYQPKWDKANAAAAEAAAALAAPPPGAQRHRLRGPAAEAAARATSPRVLERDADWPPGYDELLKGYLQEELPLSDREASKLVEAARRGQLPANRELIRMRYMHILDLEPLFPGFHAHSAVLSEPRLLRHSASKLTTAMIVFQDQWAAHPVGALMGRIGKFIVDDPVGAGHRLQALSRAMRGELGVPLDPTRLTRGSVFLTCSPYELDARVSAVATIFGRHGATRLLDVDINVLCFEPQELNGSVIALREVFSARGYGTPREYHVGTPEGAAAAAADREYVTELALTWPGVLRLPGRVGEQGVAALVAAVAEAGGERYSGPGGRGVLLADVAAKPEMLLRSAEGAGEAPGRLREVVSAVAAERDSLAGPNVREVLAGMV